MPPANELGRVEKPQGYYRIWLTDFHLCICEHILNPKWTNHSCRHSFNHVSNLLYTILKPCKLSFGCRTYVSLLMRWVAMAWLTVTLVGWLVEYLAQCREWLHWNALACGVESEQCLETLYHLLSEIAIY